MVALVSADQCPCRDHSFVQHGSRNGLGYETLSQSSKKKVAKIQDWARTPYGIFQLLHEGRQLQDKKSLSEYGRAKVSAFYMVSRVRGGAKGWGVSSSQPN